VHLVGFTMEIIYDQYSFPDINRVIKSSRMRRAVACDTYGGGERCTQGSGVEIPWKRDHLED
jgi:hypothetical protein